MSATSANARIGFTLAILAGMALGGCGDGKSAARCAPGADACAATPTSDASAGGNPDGEIIPIPTPATIASYEGTYALESFTVNPSACDTEGPSEASSHKKTFIIAGGPSARPLFLGLAACGDQTECAEKVAAIRAGNPVSADYGLFLTLEVNPDLLRDDSTYPGYDVDGTCTGRRAYESELARTGEKVRVETRTIPLADAPSENKTCPASTPAEFAHDVDGRPCSALRVISGSRTGPLP
jgi:hypothetical protein